MKACELTGSIPAATNPAMTRGEVKMQREGRWNGRRAVRAAMGMVLAGAMGAIGGCVNGSAPDKPIVIELNINIRQEVVYRLDAEAAKTIEQNKDIF